MSKLLLAFVALAFSMLAAAQEGLSSDRLGRRDTLIKIMTENAEDPALGAKIDAYLGRMQPKDAFDAEFDVLDYARNTVRVIERLDYGKGMVALHEKYFPGTAEIAVDYWRYYVMIAAKLERKEIAIEEFDYLQKRKEAEARNALAVADAREHQAGVARQQARADADAREAAYRDQQITESLQRLGDRFREMGQRTRTTNCVQYGNTTNCTTR